MTRKIRRLTDADTGEIFEVINAAAELYQGVIPEESDTDPYMPMDELEDEMDEMRFYGSVNDHLVGVIGVQKGLDVTLIRHLYVRPEHQQEGTGTDLLETAIERANFETILVGTWKAAKWAIEFYEKNGFENLGNDGDLLSTYWEIPDHQQQASIVLRYERSEL